MATAQVFSGFLFSLLFAVTVVSGLDWQCGKRYCFSSDYQIKAVASLDEADNLCRSMDSASWLLELYDEGVQQELVDFMKAHPQLQSFPLLLNLIRRGDEWRWLDNTKFDESLSDSNYKVKLFNSDPFATLRNIPFRGIYGLTYVTTLLQDHICSFEGSCSKRVVDGVNSLTYKGKCFISYENQNSNGLNWFEAQNHCYKEGGSLAVFAQFTPEELQSAFKTFAKPMENYWVGLVKETWEWRHNTDSVSNYTNWYQGYPYPPLIEMPAERVFTIFDYTNGGIWTDRGLAPVAPIVCMKEKQTSFKDTKREEASESGTTTASTTINLPTSPTNSAETTTTTTTIPTAKTTTTTKNTATTPTTTISTSTTTPNTTSTAIPTSTTKTHTTTPTTTTKVSPSQYQSSTTKSQTASTKTIFTITPRNLLLGSTV